MNFKKVLFLSAVCICTPFFSWSKMVADSARFEVFAEGLTASKIRLIGVFGDQNYLADSTVCDAQGHFVLSRVHPLPAGYYYFLSSTGKNFGFLIDKNEQFVTFRTNIADVAANMKVEGSLNSQLLYENFRYQNSHEPELARITTALRNNAPETEAYKKARAEQEAIIADRKKQLEETFKKYPDAFFTKFKIAGQNPDFVEFRKPNGAIDTFRQLANYRARFWDGIDFNDDRLLRTPVISNKLKKYIKELTPQQPDSVIAVADPLIRSVMNHKPYFQYFCNWIAMQYENTKTTVMGGEAVYVHIVNTYFTPELAFWDTPNNIAKLRKHVWEMESSLLGRIGPNITAPDVSGTERSLYDLKAKLKVVMMYSPDCEHCQKDADFLERTYKAWKDKGVEFYGIAVNTTDDEWKTFIKQHNFTFTNVFDPTNRAIYAKYYVDITPELYVLNADHKIIAMNLHAEQLEEIFRRHVK